jgi:hypothetical protein
MLQLCFDLPYLFPHRKVCFSHIRGNDQRDAQNVKYVPYVQEKSRLNVILWVWLHAVQ